MAMNYNVSMLIKLILLLLFVYALIDVWVIRHGNRSFSNKGSCIEKTKREIDSIYNCVMVQLILNLNTTDTISKWVSYGDAFNYCAQKFLKSIILTELHNMEEIKFYLNPLNEDYSCNAVTLGVGLDVKAEQALQKIYPKCNFIGADPVIEKNQELFEKELGGTFLPIAVGGEEDINFTSIIIPKNKNYGSAQIQHVNFDTFLMQNVPYRMIDLMLIDAEHAEYLILPLLADSPNESKRPLICQFNIEMHYPPAEQMKVSKETAMNQIMALFWKKKYLLAKSINSNLFRRLYFINIFQDECIEKFLSRC